MVSLVNPRSPVAHPSTKGAPTMHWPFCVSFVQVRVSNWSLSILPSPYLELQHGPLPLQSAESQGVCPELLTFPLFYTLDSSWVYQGVWERVICLCALLLFWPLILRLHLLQLRSSSLKHCLNILRQFFFCSPMMPTFPLWFFWPWFMVFVDYSFIEKKNLKSLLRLGLIGMCPSCPPYSP